MLILAQNAGEFWAGIHVKFFRVNKAQYLEYIKGDLLMLVDKKPLRFHFSFFKDRFKNESSDICSMINFNLIIIELG